MSWNEICYGRNQMMVQERPPVEGILLLRNDSQLRDFCRDCFKQYGFHAIEAEDGFEALLIAASRNRPVDVFITDIENASISGIELASMLQSISPQIKVVCLTGSGEKKRELALAQIRRLRKACVASASQSTKVVVTWR
jgi:DNA-binding NtrC family response regulator